MAPRTRTRKPLAQVNQNQPLIRTTRSALHKEQVKPQPSQPTTPPVEQPSPPVDIAHITSQLENTNLSDPAHCATPPKPVVNPFGAHLPQPAPLVLPKRPLNAYQLFCKRTRDQVCEQNPDADFAQVNGLLGAAWKALSAEQRSHFEACVADDRERYDVEMTHYKQQQGQVEKERLAIEFYEKELKIQKALEFYDKHLAEQKKELKKAPIAPKQPRNAYNFFVSAQFKEAGGISTFGLTAQIAEQWSTLQSSRKKKDKSLVQKFNQMAEEDETRYHKEMEQYQLSLAEEAQKKVQEQQQFKQAALEAYEANLKEKLDAQAFRKIQAERKVAQKEEKKKIRKEKKAAKEAKADEPKRPKNAYAIFFSAHAAEVSQYIKENDVQHSMAKEIASRWKELSDSEKASYVEEADKDRERYRNEMDTFNATQN
eukprot:TRINITY_DN782_c0_g1_i1.p4 TRINITY_DN782_c0_g1~~TRINITY_DN782_c0_g1_i1.p4  ORF type:complete len:427 (+),score=124.64 TRINITY_DN782_c0_g1_i1:1328-2608(+)